MRIASLWLALYCAVPPTWSGPLGGRDPGFNLAIEYAVPGLAKTYAATGLTDAKPQIEFGVWGNLEPQPGKYNWRPLDGLVAEYQAAGFTDLQLLISAESPWASVDPKKNPFPKSVYLDDYCRFVSRFVERYDGDGMDDAPGLRYPVHHYGIEREFTGFWHGSAEDYVRLLRLAYPTIHTADSKSQVLLVALLMIDVFDGAPGTDEVQRRFTTTPSYRKSLADIRTILAAHDAYDLVDFHSLGDYVEIPPTVAWIRKQLKSTGCDRPIWIGDCFSLSLFVGFNARPFAPVTPKDKDRALALLQCVANPKDVNHAASVAWLQAEMARGLVKKIVVAAGEGLRGINIGNMEDWKTGLAGIDEIAVAGMGTCMFMGMTDTVKTLQSSIGNLPYQGNDWTRERRAGKARPVFNALRLVVEKLRWFTSVEKLEVGKDVWAYRFERPQGPVWVVWNDDGALHLPGRPATKLLVTLPWQAAGARITDTPTLPGQSQAEWINQATREHTLSMSLGATPVFVEESGTK